jgi:hypothetical protein
MNYSWLVCAFHLSLIPLVLTRISLGYSILHKLSSRTNINLLNFNFLPRLSYLINMNSEISYKSLGLGTIFRMFACRPYQTIQEFRKKRRDDQIECERVKSEEPPTVAPRSRALSNVVNATAVSQLQSRLFQLPAELRMKIYTELLSKEDDVHLYSYHGYGVYSATFRTPEDTDRSYRKPRYWTKGKRLITEVKPASNLGILGFISCCHQA